MNKKLLLLAGILALGATTFAVHTPTAEEGTTVTAEKAAQVISITDSSAIEGLVEGRQTGILGEFSGSYNGEVRARMFQGPGRSNDGVNANKIEWTVGKGKLNMGRFGFKYDVDRDFNYDSDWNRTNDGWDTTFGIDFQGGTFDMLGKEWTFVPSVSYGYDTAENFTSDSATPSARDMETKRRWDFNPKVSTTYYGFAMDISPIVAYDDVNDTTAFELDFSNYRALGTEGLWSTYGDVYLDFAGTKKNGSYKNSLFSGNIDGDDKFALSIEQYLGYEREVAPNTYFITEFGLEAYSINQKDAYDVSMYVAPEVQYRAKLGAVNVTPYAKYTGYTANVDSAGKDELSVGVKFGTSF
ncbi:MULTISPECIES: hypothetical protein [Psychrilyobacter]|uniref:Porin n=1 Tax=Psychrilyobacter piezotolerans TaxID=2293438 RepID=A0ABX9KLC0_9FUSO|nr:MULTISPECIES: hypothetical protein [Psychrilyobacter]MCS5421039.1 hypothetical protein [Psychrilyobacter sp. S5]NDI76318.1 hypothetical protein [Psychrilyobacter piezotolerans]RDE65917.1 hypothetical protein DV867_00135 [Psychrilyobacter sp. S5]REI43095.1 hypothetical protein DYH56_00135 [Psychrilyobacter piezotolerans]